MSDEAYHEPHNLQQAITINDTDGQSVEDDDTHYSTAGEFETVVDTDTFELDDTFSETSQSSNSQGNIDFNINAITKAAIRKRRRCVTCMSVIPLLVSLVALVSLLISQNSENEEGGVYLNDDTNNNNNATILNVAEDTVQVVESKPSTPTLERPFIPTLDVEYIATEAIFDNVAKKTRSPSSSSPTPYPSLSPTVSNPTKSPSLSPTTKNVSLCSVAFEMGAVHLIRENGEDIYHKYMTCGTRHVSHVIPSFVYHLFLNVIPFYIPSIS